MNNAIIKTSYLARLIIQSFTIIFLSCTDNNNNEVTPIPPSNLVASAVSPSQIDLSWTDNSTNESGFKIERKTGAETYSAVATIDKDINTYSDKNLTDKTTYTYRIYSYNSAGKSPTYSNEIAATTKNLPIVTTNPITLIVTTNAKAGGTVTFEGNIAARGVVWNTSPNPAVTLPTKTLDGNGVGTFVSSLTLLSPNTKYYFRAYATNELGTFYGDEVTFTTENIEYYSVISSGLDHSLALKTDGTLWAWGSNNEGQLGDGTTVKKSSPVQVGTGYAAISAGGYHSLALKTDGTLWAWGNNDNGQLGNGTTVDKSSPVQIGTGYASISAGLFHSLGIKKNSTLWAWGYNYNGQLGDGTNGVNGQKTTPVQVGTGYASISAGGQHSLGIKTDGTLWAWGDNWLGQLGDGTEVGKITSIQVGSGYSSISACIEHSFGIKTDGTIWAWGHNDLGQLGDGTTVNKISPVQVGTGYATISAVDMHSLALKKDGTLWAWGHNDHSQLGDGTTVDKSSPIQLGAGYASIAAGRSFSLALKTDGTLWAWGWNGIGQLGDGTNVDKNIPSHR